MLCENCQKELATVHVTKIINGYKTEMHLCENCARELGEVGLNIEIPNLFAGFFEPLQGITSSFVRQRECPTCHSTLEDFRNRNLFGCSDCYETFKNEIEPLLRRLHGSSRHEGKVPLKGHSSLSIEHRIKMLREQLQQAVELENYERAAQLRDQIRELENQARNKGEK